MPGEDVDVDGDLDVDGNVDDDVDGDVSYVVGEFMLMLCWLMTRLCTRVPGNTGPCQVRLMTMMMFTRMLMLW